MVGERQREVILLVELLGNKDQIKNVHSPIAVGVQGGFAETVGNLYQI